MGYEYVNSFHMPSSCWPLCQWQWTLRYCKNVKDWYNAVTSKVVNIVGRAWSAKRMATRCGKFLFLRKEIAWTKEECLICSGSLNSCVSSVCFQGPYLNEVFLLNEIYEYHRNKSRKDKSLGHKKLFTKYKHSRCLGTFHASVQNHSVVPGICVFRLRAIRWSGRRVYHDWVSWEMNTKFWCKILKRGGYSEDVCIDMKIILKCILYKYGFVRGLDSSGFG